MASNINEVKEQIFHALPRLYSTDNKKLKHVPVVIYHMFSRWTWYVVESDGKDLIFTYCKSGLGEDCDEWGYASLNELLSLSWMRVEFTDLWIDIDGEIQQNH